MSETARWFLFEGMVHLKEGAVPPSHPHAPGTGKIHGAGAVREQPAARRHVQAGARHRGMFVLWNGNGLVVKHVERIAGIEGEPGLHLTSTNADYADYTALACGIYIVGKVLWTVRRA